MEEQIPRERADRRQLQQIIAGLTEGVVLVDPDGTIVWANETALALHGVERLEDLAATRRDIASASNSATGTIGASPLEVIH